MMERMGNDKGISLAFVLVLILSIFLIGGGMIASSLMSTRVSKAEEYSVVAYGTAQAGAQMINKAFSIYIRDLNEMVATLYTEEEILEAIEGGLDLIGFLRLGQPAINGDL